jgi:hypothetical protein
MAWLAGQQNPDGSWGVSNQVARTGFAVLKFETHAIENNIDPLNPSYTYYPQVRDGLNYIFSQAIILGISTQPHGDPDTDGDGIGVYFPSNILYETGVAMMAIASSTHPGMIVNVVGSAVNGWTYREVLQDVVDFVAFAQNDAGNARGGWRYSWNQPSSDNSVTGYVVLGLGYAQAPPPSGFELSIPDFVKTELDVFIEFIQDDVSGGSGYTSPGDVGSYNGFLRTGNLLYEMWFVGDTATTPRVMAAIGYLVSHWDDTTGPRWKGIPAEYQAMYTTMKGFEALGIHEIDGIDWQAEYEEVLLEQQQTDGSWPASGWGDEMLSTEWALLTLEKVVPPPPPPTLKDVKEEIIAIEEKLDFWLPEIKAEIVLIEEKLHILPDIKEEIVAIEVKLDKWLPDIKAEIVLIEEKLHILPDIKEEIVAIEDKLDKKIARQELKVKLDKAKVGNDNRYFLLTTLAGKRVDPTKVTVYIGDKELEQDNDYTYTKIIDGTHEINIDHKAIPPGKASSLVVDAEYNDYIGSDLLSIARGNAE